MQSTESVKGQCCGGHLSALGLPDHGQLAARLGGLLASRRRDQVVVLLVELDQLALVARAYGHRAADELLIAVAGRLRSAVRDDDWLASCDRDRFVVVCEASGGLEVAQGIAGRIREVLIEAFPVDGDAVVVTVAIGIAVSESSSVDPDRLLADADLALAVALDEGGDRSALFTPTERDEARARVTLPAALHRGLDRGEFVVHYQPVVDLESDEPTGAEALVRWDHPERGLLGPDQFIEAAESTGLIGALGTWVLQEACRSAVSWPRSAAQEPLGVAVNLSARQLEDPDLVDLVKDTLSDTGLEPKLLTLEVTERIMVRYPGVASGRLEELRSLGVRVAIDDFGTGYSCLGSLKDLPLDIIKVDQSFVAGLCVDPVDRAIVAAIVTLARALRLDVIAEGVETVDQATELRRLGCSHIQGYLVGRPEPGAPHSTLRSRGGGGQAEDHQGWSPGDGGFASRGAGSVAQLDAHAHAIATEVHLVSPGPWRGQGTSPRRPPRVLVLDDDGESRQVVCRRLAGEEEFELVGEAEAGEAGITLASIYDPDIVLLGHDKSKKPRRSGLGILPELRRAAPAAKIAVLSTTHPDSSMLVEVLLGGGDTCLDKATAIPLLPRLLALLGEDDPDDPSEPPPASRD